MLRTTYTTRCKSIVGCLKHKWVPSLDKMVLTFLPRIIVFPSAYELCMWTFVIALAHFCSELFIYKTAKLGPGSISPLIVACTFLRFLAIALLLRGR